MTGAARREPRKSKAMRSATLWFGVAAAALPGAGGVAAQGVLEGTVRNAATNQPVAGAHILLDEVRLAGTTGPGGAFRIGGIPAGTHHVEVQLIGYRSVRRTVRVADGAAARLDVLLDETALALEGVVAVGSRARPRTATQSLVPIDAIPPADFQDQGETDLSDLLRTVIPSYNVNPEARGDAATIVRPANLRGLAPDHTLLLVNGRRRHRAAVITWIGNGVSDGAQGADVSAVPAIALRQVEVLRDGASAQYGSDAIAGVVNLQLRDDRSGGRFEVRGGGFGDGDGETWTVAGNVGLPLGRAGFANLSAEYGNSNPTSRSVQRADAALLVANGNPHVRDPAQIWGAPRVEDDVKLWGHFGGALGDRTRFYGHAGYASETVTGGFFYRNPNTRAGVFSLDGGETLLIGDLLDAQDGGLDGTAGCPVVRVTRGVPDPAAIARVFADPNCFSFQERFPGGFTPQFGGDAVDASVVAGIKGEFESGLQWDASAGWGSNEVDFFIYNTVNASLGEDTPTDFDPGLYRQRELNVNVDAAYAPGGLVSLAGGAEWRRETFHIGIGEPDAWRQGPLAPQGFSSGSNGFPGFSPIAAGEWNRANYAVYADAELGSDDRPWGAGAAVRLEDFQGFGRTVNGKLAARYQVSRMLALRASASTGFRAPTPGQQNAFNVSTEFDRELNDLVNNGTIPSTSRVAALRDGRALEPERSFSAGFGAAFESGSLRVTTDYFRVAVSDRLALTRPFVLTSDERETLVEEGITSAANLQNFRFFTNNFETRTQGVDVVAAFALPIMDGIELSLAFNHTRTSVVAYDPSVLDEERIRQIEEGLPRTRWLYTAKHALGPVGVLGRLSWFGGWFDARDDRSYSGAPLLDLEAAYSFGEGLTLTAGAQNALNRHPERNPQADRAGNLYGPNSPFGTNGGFYYVRLGYRWN